MPFFTKIWNFHNIIDFSEQVTIVQKVLGNFFWATILTFKWI
jgi:hypothetical protein